MTTKLNRVSDGIQKPAPPSGFSPEDYEQLSAILEDYVSLALSHARALRKTRTGANASEILHKWIDRAYALREKAEAILGRVED